ncbi:MAG: glycogen debranching protein [Bacteroidales bacterium]|nr:glycogen debranching protein [Bacteroidales bacterium]
MLTSILLTMAAAASPQVVVQTDAYVWRGDSLIQDDFVATAPTPFEIQSTYSARPGYFMPVEKVWKLKNDISAYPSLKSSNTLLQAVYNMGLDEMVNAVEPDTTLRTGKEWAGVWTRDVSYSIILSMAALQPEASKISLMKKVNPEGQIIQDTGSGGAWPVSTDRLVWALAADEIYRVTGDKKWLREVYPIIERSIAKDDDNVISPDGLAMGETSFIDWREQSYPKWMQTADIARSEAMNTNMVRAAALRVLAFMAADLGKKKDAEKYSRQADELVRNIDARFWMPEKGYYGMYTYGRDNLILNPRAETLGESLAILYGIADEGKARSITESNPVTPFGAAIFYPQIADMPSYHNNALWPFVGAYWALANAKAHNEEGTLEAIGAIVRPAALFATNKENFNLDNGDIFTELNSSNMLWSLSGNLALTNKILFGMNFRKDGILFAPFVPEALAETRSLEDFPYRGGRFSVTVSGYGDKIASMTVNGKKHNPALPVDASLLAKGATVDIVMNSEPIAPMSVNRRPNLKAPLTPIAWIEDGELVWNPIEYIGHYKVLRDGKTVAETRTTTYPLLEPGEWQVIGVSSDGVESFASEPRSNRPVITLQMSGETTSMHSSEISYPAQEAPEGYTGAGFVETDHNSGPVSVSLSAADFPEAKAGRYSLRLRYANGNGPVNTENKCAVRSIIVDGKKVGTIVMPQRGVGNWNDWGYSDSVIVELEPGAHTFSVEYLPGNENMNLGTNHALIDAIILTRQ